MTNQFATAKEFANFICQQRYSRSHLMNMNKKSGDARLTALAEDIERYASTARGWGVENDGIQREYGQAVFGLHWSIASDRLNGETVLAIRALNTRQLCELVHELMVFGYDIGRYPEYLMRKYTPQHFVNVA